MSGTRICSLICGQSSCLSNKHLQQPGLSAYVIYEWSLSNQSYVQTLFLMVVMVLKRLSLFRRKKTRHRKQDVKSRVNIPYRKSRELRKKDGSALHCKEVDGQKYVRYFHILSFRPNMNNQIKQIVSLKVNLDMIRFKYFMIHRNCPQRRTPSQNGGSASRIHQHTAPKRGPPLEFINIQPPKGSPPLEFINIQPQNGESASRIHQHQPKNGGPPLGTISMDLAVHIHLILANV